MRLVDRLVWLLTGRPRPLFGPTVLAEVTIVVDHDGRGHLFSPRFLDEDQETLLKVAVAIVRTGAWFAQSHGVEMQLVPTNVVGQKNG